MKHRLLNFLIAIDQLLYVLVTLGAGSPDETLSAAAYRTEQKGKLLGKVFRPIIDFIFLAIETKHCYKAFLSEVNKQHLPKEYRNRKDNRVQ